MVLSVEDFKRLSSSRVVGERLKAAKDKSCPSDILIRLGGGSERDGKVILAAWRNPNYPVSDLEKKVTSDNPYLNTLTGILSMESLSRIYVDLGGKQAEDRLWRVDTNIVCCMMRQQNCPPEVIKEALVPNTSKKKPKHWATYADVSFLYRKMVAARRWITPEQISELLVDPDVRIRRILVKNSYVPKEALVHLFESETDVPILRSLAYRFDGALREDTLARIVEGRRVGKQVGRLIFDLSVDPDKFATLCEAESKAVRTLGAISEYTRDEDKVLAGLLGVNEKA